jgi:hypothetical protein
MPHQIARVLALFRKGWPVLHPYVSQKKTRKSARRQVPREGDACVATTLSLKWPRAKRCVPTEEASERVLRYATCELSNERSITLVVTGCTASGCVR